MEVYIRILALILTYLSLLVDKISAFFNPRQPPKYPAIKDPLLLKSVVELILELKRDQLTSEHLVKTYIARVREVNPSINAVIEERFEAALQEARHADELIASAKTEYDRVALFTRYSLLGIPFTVKESCGVKGLSFAVGSVVRKGMKAPCDGHVVELMRAAGGIPLLVSATPEFCMSFETSTVLNGRCLNPYNHAHSPGGSSGGEAALNGCGASLFGVASDISGSIRLPAMFCGVYGHKPTGGLTSVQGHFPYTAQDENFPNMLQIGPITRFASDMPLLLEIMAGNNKHKLRMAEPVALKDIKVHYAYGFSDKNSMTRPNVDPEIQLAIARAVKSFEKAGLRTEPLQMNFLDNSMEVALVGLLDLKGVPSIVTQQSNRPPKMRLLCVELFNSLIGHSLFTKEALFVELMHRLNGLVSVDHMERYREEARSIKTYLTELLGDRGVLLLPTFHRTALNFHTSLFHITGIDNLLIFNVLGFPATQVAMGYNQLAMPIGIQVVAAPYQDKLCLQVAAALEAAFRGWAPPIAHQLA
ncbi:hypothetical protein KR093_002946 [Drosophila rubida]|uniref:Amidase domain-containing protein n=1 Tax=Drosophila rubida TaxID=30044 RepID=A0AAD4JSL6_9MUSC|nr:hypothetical protein KR093_002946 [Drosophila rubida]